MPMSKMARTCEEAAHQHDRAAAHYRHSAIHVAAAALLGQVRPSQELDRRADDRQEVVEVMRHAAGQLADGVHLLGLQERGLRLGQLPRPLFDAQLKGVVHALQRVSQAELGRDAPVDVASEAHGQSCEARDQDDDEEGRPRLGLHHAVAHGIKLKPSEEQRDRDYGRQQVTGDRPCLAAAERRPDPRPVWTAQQHPGRERAQGDCGDQGHAGIRAALVEAAEVVGVADPTGRRDDEGAQAGEAAEVAQAAVPRVLQEQARHGRQDAHDRRNGHAAVRFQGREQKALDPIVEAEAPWDDVLQAPAEREEAGGAGEGPLSETARRRRTRPRGQQQRRRDQGTGEGR